MPQIYELVEGWTSRLTFQLTDDGAAFDGSVSYTHLTLPTNREV